MKMEEKKKLGRLNMNWTVLFIVSRPITSAAIDAYSGCHSRRKKSSVSTSDRYTHIHFIRPDTFQPEIYFFFLNRDIHFISLFKVDDLLKPQDKRKKRKNDYLRTPVLVSIWRLSCRWIGPVPATRKPQRRYRSRSDKRWKCTSRKTQSKIMNHGGRYMTYETKLKKPLKKN
jgi:hypothetical protein